MGWRGIVRGLGNCPDPIGMITVLEALDFDFATDAELGVDICGWDHKTQNIMINKLIVAGYEVIDGLLDGVIKSGNIDGLNVLNDIGNVNYELALNLATRYGKIDIMHHVRVWSDPNLLDIVLTGLKHHKVDPAALSLLISWARKNCLQYYITHVAGNFSSSEEKLIFYLLQSRWLIHIINSNSMVYLYPL